jgi:hypothetical protein
MRNPFKRLAASAAAGVAMVAAASSQLMAQVYGIYECTLSAVLITGDGVYGIYDCVLVAILITPNVA